MLYFLLGLGILLLALIVLNSFKQANAAAFAQQVRVVAGCVVLAGAAFLGPYGMLGLAMPLAMLGYWLLFGSKLPPWAYVPGTGNTGAGQTSRIVTDHLEMVLDHETGAMHGRVLKGVFKSRSIERLAPAELALLWRDCRFADPKSAQLIEAWLDRAHSSWREDMARAEGEKGAGGITTREEALEILGLKPGANEDDIRKAHRELIMKLHPDRGGSDYLARKINEAKDLLLGR